MPENLSDRAHDPAAMRRPYARTPRTAALDEADLPADPFALFATWFADAVTARLDEPNAMVVSTADAAGRPSSRTVLLKGWDDGGFVFFTNYRSRKGAELTANPHAALLFPWHPMARQVLVAGTAARTSAEETAAYFRTRPYGSRIGAWASEQSAPLAAREDLERRHAELAARWPEGTEVPVPPHWGGFRVVPGSVEFWQGRENRLHDRLVYRRPAPSAPWTVVRLNP